MTRRDTHCDCRDGKLKRVVAGRREAEHGRCATLAVTTRLQVGDDGFCCDDGLLPLGHWPNRNVRRRLTTAAILAMLHYNIW